MMVVADSVAQQAELRRQEGNSYFKREKFGAAIDAYTEAITLCPRVAIYWTNRALCYLRKSEWERVESDSIKALELDSASVKGHYFLGLALLEKEEYADGIKHLEKALDLGRGADPAGYMVEEIWQALANAKYKDWESSSSERMWRMQRLKDSCVEALTKQHALTLPCDDVEDPCDRAANLTRKLTLLDAAFAKATEADNQKEVPDYLCCRITLDILRDPVITPSGITYERAALVQHFEKVGYFDPTTREPLEEDQLVPNIALKQAVQAYLEDHGWAYRLS